MKNKKDNKPYFDEREVFIKTINEKDKRIAELEAECERLRTDANPTLLKGEEVIAIAEKVIAAAPAAKPIVWEGSDDSSWLGCVGSFNFNILCDEQDGVKYWGVAAFLDGSEVANQDVDSPDEGKKAAQNWFNKLVADMSIASTCPENVSKNGEDLKVSDSTGLNPSNSRGLKSNCTEKSDSSVCKESLHAKNVDIAENAATTFADIGNPIPRFTKAEVEAIRKIAQFMGVTVADSIIAKCDAMLKGAEG